MLQFSFAVNIYRNEYGNAGEDSGSADYLDFPYHVYSVRITRHETELSVASWFRSDLVPENRILVDWGDYAGCVPGEDSDPSTFDVLTELMHTETSLILNVHHTPTQPRCGAAPST